MRTIVPEISPSVPLGAQRIGVERDCEWSGQTAAIVLVGVSNLRLRETPREDARGFKIEIGQKS